MRPIWLSREEALEPLLLFSIAVGVAHVTLGLGIGIFLAWRARSRHAILAKVGTLAALAGLFAIAGSAAGRIPAGAMTPGVAGLVVGLAMLIAGEGPLGILTAPLELLGTVGNMLSYLRIAAIGLASVYLSRVANELGAAAPLWLGIAVAALFHGLNVALGAFSPTIQAMRLHYVEFFGKFYEGGGKAFAPFGGKTP
jgi:V/A-type H+-transporting ATPase subunit I